MREYIILLDLNRPDMSGYEVLCSLRVAKVKTPILILTGLGGNAARRVASCGSSSPVDINTKRLTRLANGTLLWPWIDAATKCARNPP